MRVPQLRAVRGAMRQSERHGTALFSQQHSHSLMSQRPSSSSRSATATPHAKRHSRLAARPAAQRPHLRHRHEPWRVYKVQCLVPPPVLCYHLQSGRWGRECRGGGEGSAERRGDGEESAEAVGKRAQGRWGRERRGIPNPEQSRQHAREKLCTCSGTLPTARRATPTAAGPPASPSCKHLLQLLARQRLGGPDAVVLYALLKPVRKVLRARRETAVRCGVSQSLGSPVQLAGGKRQRAMPHTIKWDEGMCTALGHAGGRPTFSRHTMRWALWKSASGAAAFLPPVVGSVGGMDCS